MADLQIITIPGRISETIADIPGDKSISHRALMIGAISESKVRVQRFLFSQDCQNTMTMFRVMGVHIDTDPKAQTVTISGRGLHGLERPSEILDAGNSGTCIRLMTGLLSAQPFESRITGDTSVQKRPMGRVTRVLNQMGARIDGQSSGDDVRPPLTINKGFKKGEEIALKPITYELPVASAQVKSAILLAAITQPITVTVIEPQVTRDHTERMLEAFGAEIRREGLAVTLTGGKKLHVDGVLEIPGDISSAAFFIVLGLLHPCAKIRITHVGVNPTRDAVLRVLQRMGANMEIPPRNMRVGEPMGNIVVGSSPSLRRTDILPNEIPILIDEIPILAITGLWADGGFEVRGAKELRVKESDRIRTTLSVIQAMGGTFVEYEDGFRVEQLPPGEAEQLRHIPFEVDSGGDHRIAMAALVGAVAAGRRVTVHNTDCMATSFPNFVQIMVSLGVTFA
ncbi:MAG: 3-phosphoshikimate 1-carboxyvinyltransferase [Candidatus Margulisiibacteriota bacterium]